MDQEHKLTDHSLKKSKAAQPYIPASQHLPELTFKAIFLGIVLSIVMGGANAYLGLKVGLTVSACIPAAVVSMAILRFFRNSNVLENNIVQTTASAGETAAAGLVFTLPALIMMGYWEHFSFWMTTCVVTIGGLLGVMLSIPLRRALIIESNLRFPEGVATAEVIQAGDRQGEHDQVKELVWGGIASACIKFAQSGLQIMSENFHYWVIKGPIVLGFGGGFSAAVIGSGYIIGFQACISVIVGGIIAWIIGVPLYGLINGVPEVPTAYQAAMMIWGDKIRFMGVGAMVVGGFWTLVILIDPIRQAIKSSLEAFRRASRGVKDNVLRTERDISFVYVLGGVFLLTLCLIGVVYYVLSDQQMEINFLFYIAVVVVIGLSLVMITFLCASIAGYMTGLLGSTQTPFSGVTIIAILIISGIMLFLLDHYVGFSIHPEEALKASGAVILMGCIVACAAAVSGDNLQDLKSGQLLGSTPWKQQVMLMVGVLAGALTLAPITELLFQAYGMGNVMPREGMDPSQVLSAPKAAVMAALSQSIFSGSMDWVMFLLGALVAVGAILVDSFLKWRKSVWQLPVLGVAMGIYMPLEVTVPILIGGVVRFFVDRSIDMKSKKQGAITKTDIETAKRRSTLLAAGFIAGESILGVTLAVPFIVYQSTSVFKFVPVFFEPFTSAFGFIVTAGLCFWLFRSGSVISAKDAKFHK